MAFVSKYVSIACLTYLLYGVISQFNVGIFLPPLPLKPFLLLFFVVLGGIHLFKAGFLLSEVSLIFLVAAMAIQHHAFIETFSSQGWMYTSELYFTEVVSVIAFICFFTHVLISCIPVLKRFWPAWFPLFGLLVLLLYTFFFESGLTLLIPLSFWSLFVFIIRRQPHTFIQHQFRFAPILYGTTVLQWMDELTLQLFS